MPRFALSRRSALLMPLLLAACGDYEDAQSFAPLRYNYLPPIELNVASIEVEQRFVPAGVPPDVSNQDPVPPIDALKAMANDRLMAFGTQNKAVFAILNASLTKQGDVIAGTFEVALTILDNSGARLGFATAQVHSDHTGSIDSLRATLYDMTKSMMSDMNVEFEYQVRRNLKQFLTSATAPDMPVQQQPLDQSSGTTPPADNPAPGSAPYATPAPGSAPYATPAPGSAPYATPAPGSAP